MTACKRITEENGRGDSADRQRKLDLRQRARHESAVAPAVQLVSKRRALVLLDDELHESRGVEESRPSRASSSTLAALLIQRPRRRLRILGPDRRVCSQNLEEATPCWHEHAPVDQLGQPGRLPARTRGIDTPRHRGQGYRA